MPPDAVALDRAGGGRAVYLSRVDAHSALASTALLSAVPAAVAGPGFDPSGWLFRDAHHSVRVVALGSVTPGQRRAAQLATLRRAASLGIAAVHECGGPDLSDEDDFSGLLSLAGAAEALPRVFGFWGELGAAEKARELGAVGAGGDLFADGALGSRTAYLREPYVDDADGGVGHGYLSPGEVAEHVVECTRLGLQAGFHAIGDGALAAVLAGFAVAAGVVGRDRLRAARHRIEHAELLDRALTAAMVEFGLVASVQPAFDRMWGGDSGMYAARLGAARALGANPYAALAGVGVTLAFGSDSPVTPLDPWGAVLAAMRHHNPAQRLGLRAAFAAHTRGGWRAVRRDDAGVLLPGASATFAVWDAPGGVVAGLPSLVAQEPDEPDPGVPVCRRTVSRGVVIFDSSGDGDLR
jgi:predicted amidohydrolase YtcJ